MRKILLMLLMTGYAGAQTTATYTGVIKDLAQQVVTSGQVTFTLTLPSSSTIPGVGTFTPSTIACNINVDGTLSGFVGGVASGPCNVTMNTALTPTGTSYKVCIQPYFTTPGSCFFDYAINSKDITTVVPTLQTGPVNFGGVPGPPIDFEGVWSSSTVYRLGQAVSFNNVVYISLVNPNLNHTPSSSPSQWSVVQSPASLTAAPSITQTVTQPVDTDFNVVTSGTGSLKSNGNSVLTVTPGTQSLVQTFPTSLNGTSNGTFNEESFAGADVNHRVAAAMTACGTSYRFVCTILIPPYAPIDQTTMPESTGNNVMIIDQRAASGQGVFQNRDIDGGCTPFQVNCPTAVLPGLKGNIIYSNRVGANDPQDSIDQPTQSNVLGCSISANVATCTTSNPNSFIVGEQVVIAEMKALPFLNNLQLNSFYTVLASGLTSTQFSFNFTHANVAFTADSGVTGVICTFCGKNVFNVAATAYGGITHTNGSDGSLQTGFMSVFRDAASSRQVVALNLTAQCFMNQSSNFGNDFCQGLQINMTNRDALDPLSNQAGIFITAGGGTVGTGIQMTGAGVGGGFNVGQLMQGYKGFGLSLNGLPGRIADIHIVPLLNDGSHEIEGQNAENNATVWHIDSNGAMSMPIVNATGQLNASVQAQFNGSIINGTAFQRTTGTLGCTTAAAVGSTCTTAQLPWTLAFPDLNYEVTCSLDTPTGVPVISSVARNTTGFTVTIAALTAAAATANYECIAVHN